MQPMCMLYACVYASLLFMLVPWNWSKSFPIFVRGADNWLLRGDLNSQVVFFFVSFDVVEHRDRIAVNFILPLSQKRKILGHGTASKVALITQKLKSMPARFPRVSIIPNDFAHLCKTVAANPSNLLFTC